MNDLKALLRKYSPPLEIMAGADDAGGVPPKVPEAFEQKQFRADLAKIRRSVGFWFAVCIIAALVVAAWALLLALWQPCKPTVSTAVGAGGGMAGYMIALKFAADQLKKRTQTDLLIALARTMEPDTLQTIVAALVRSLS